MCQVFRKMLWSTSESRFEECVKYLGRCCGVHLRAVLINVSVIYKDDVELTSEDRFENVLGI